ncbi:hypothetical protein BHM03_00057482 [Ensete ventricosum]|nr:hypothetical protein BHM03_00057482 [Ensete ventricosum]
MEKGPQNPWDQGRYRSKHSISNRGDATGISALGGGGGGGESRNRASRPNPKRIQGSRNENTARNRIDLFRTRGLGSDGDATDRRALKDQEVPKTLRIKEGQDRNPRNRSEQRETKKRSSDLSPPGTKRNCPEFKVAQRKERRRGSRNESNANLRPEPDRSASNPRRRGGKEEGTGSIASHRRRRKRRRPGKRKEERGG